MGAQSYSVYKLWLLSSDTKGVSTNTVGAIRAINSCLFQIKTIWTTSDHSMLFWP